MKKSKEPEHKGNHERWLLTYADMITLLMTFFIVMYAMSIADTSKMKKLADSLHDAFLGQGNPQMIKSRDIVAPKEGDALTNPGDSGKEEEVRMSEIQDKLYELIEKENLAAQIMVEMEDRGLVIRLSESMLFSSGEATVKADAYKKLNKVAKLLDAAPNYIRVEGHTDNLPIHSGLFRSNWQLSTERATHIVELLTVRAGEKTSRSRFSAVGYAEYRPLATNATDIGRANNRRVDIVLLKARLNSSEENRPVSAPSFSSPSL